MNQDNQETIADKQANQALRQQDQAFNQRKAHNNWWLAMRLIMGMVIVVLLPFIAYISYIIVSNTSKYNATTVTLASSALLVDVLGLIGVVFKIILDPKSVKELEPTTHLLNPPLAAKNPALPAKRKKVAVHANTQDEEAH